MQKLIYSAAFGPSLPHKAICGTRLNQELSFNVFSLVLILFSLVFLNRQLTFALNFVPIDKLWVHSSMGLNGGECFQRCEVIRQPFNCTF